MKKALEYSPFMLLLFKNVFDGTTGSKVCSDSKNMLKHMNEAH